MPSKPRPSRSKPKPVVAEVPTTKLENLVEVQEPESIVPEIEPLILDLDNISSFVTVTGALFERFYQIDYQNFSECSAFENGTSPFCSKSYLLNNSNILIALDNRGLWILKSNKRSLGKEPVVLCSFEDALSILQTLPLDVPMKFD